ncbi:hypothetical protein QQS21_000301 [Conoideocrella luteorostrata]|uniref:Uncharacterized protein n=1 Tax=Conoideocrella luteorostrata TaxID=1105319 RepID=A0AAJ0CZ06_9HYPO|nr:hypothetical protein QQS21_000301 [Conoideocrella luteorostrata]
MGVTAIAKEVAEEQIQRRREGEERRPAKVEEEEVRAEKEKRSERLRVKQIKPEEELHAPRQRAPPKRKLSSFAERPPECGARSGCARGSWVWLHSIPIRQMSNIHDKRHVIPGALTVSSVSPLVKVNEADDDAVRAAVLRDEHSVPSNNVAGLQTRPGKSFADLRGETL